MFKYGQKRLYFSWLSKHTSLVCCIALYWNWWVRSPSLFSLFHSVPRPCPSVNRRDNKNFSPKGPHNYTRVSMPSGMLSYRYVHLHHQASSSFVWIMYECVTQTFRCVTRSDWSNWIIFTFAHLLVSFLLSRYVVVWEKWSDVGYGLMSIISSFSAVVAMFN